MTCGAVRRRAGKGRWTDEEHLENLSRRLAAADGQCGGGGGAAGVVPGAVPVRLVQHPVQLGPLRYGVHQPHQRGSGQRGRRLRGAGPGGEHRRAGAAGTGEQRPDGLGVRGQPGGGPGRGGVRRLLRGADRAGGIYRGFCEHPVRRPAPPADTVLREREEERHRPQDHQQGQDRRAGADQHHGHRQGCRGADHGGLRVQGHGAGLGGAGGRHYG